MHIELLWMIPVVAFAALLFIVAYYAQRHAEQRSKGNNLSSEVALFNAGHNHAPQKLVNAHSSDDRLHEMEKAINFVAESLANQQQSITSFHKESGVYTNEINELKDKLRTVFKEYDIVLSENYSLRAKVKQLSKQVQESAPASAAAGSLDPLLTRSTTHTKPALHLYDDTRLINLTTMDSDDMSESTDSLAR
jgi:septal ring factor EnvC (AmiA/AmiB activator)